MKSLITNLGYGIIELNLPMCEAKAVYFLVTRYQDITEKVIPLFDKYPVKGNKV